MVVIEFEDGIPLPLGTELNTPERRVHANPLIQFLVNDIEIESTTESGWPTLITGESEGSRIGVAVDYLGDWREVPIDEIDVVIDEEQRRSVLVTYSRKEAAIEEGQYNVHTYTGYELHEWKPENHPEIIEDCVNRNVTPIFHTPDKPYYPALAYQRAEYFDPLKRMFRLSQYSTLIEREERLYQRVIPREERWRDEDTTYQDLAKDILDSDS